MAKTVEQVLKESGLADEAIKALDQKVMQGLSTVLTAATSAEQAAAAARQEAERAQRAQQELYDQQIAPALDAWASEKANLEAQAAFYKTQNEQARSGGFVPKDAPGFTAPQPQRAPDGRYVAGANPVPGSPQYITQEQAYKALTNANWVQNEYFRLFKEPIPDEIENLLKEATDNHLDFRTYASRKYKFDEKKSEIASAKQKEHDDKIRQETAAAKDKEWAEKVGSNPNVRVAVSSGFSNLSKAVKAGEIKDPLTMSSEERHRATSSMIQKDISEQNSQTVQ
jgi:hypothetical protein